jgi:hypothetical protein
MNRELLYLILTKVGLLVAALAWIIPPYVVDGVIGWPWSSLIVIVSFLGTGLWGFSYGVIYEMDNE